MKLSVVICTWNRAQSLTRLLQSLAQAEQPERAEWEVLVVNNHCTDETDHILEQFIHQLPIKRVFEPNRGLSHARNAAVAAATGDYFLWTDDDVTVAPKWLRSYEAAFERWPEAVVFGGPVIPRFEAPSPLWIHQKKETVLPAYAGIDLGNTVHMFDRTSNGLPYGANFAIRGVDQRQVRYDTRLGRRPGPSIIGFEETEVLRKILAQGKVGWWLPDTSVEHWIPPSRQTTQYLRAFYHGIGQVLASSLVHPCQSYTGRQRFRLYTEAITLEILYRYHKQVSQPDKWLQVLEQSSVAWGRLTGLNQLSRTETSS